MIISVVPIVVTLGTSYFTYDKFILPKIDCPINNELIKDKSDSELKNGKQILEKEIEALIEKRDKFQDDIKVLREGSDDDKDDKILKLESKKLENELELEKAKASKEELKLATDKSIQLYFPNKFTWNNIIWGGGFIIYIILLHKITVLVCKYVFKSIGFEEIMNDN